MTESDLLKRYIDIMSRDHVLNEEPVYKNVTEDDLNPEDDAVINESRPVNITGLIQEITDCPSIDKRVDVWSQADGMAGLFRTVDGNAYEITIRQAGETKHPGLQRKT